MAIVKRLQVLLFLVGVPLLLFSELPPSQEAIFTKIYQTGAWGVNENGEGVSGPGSETKHARPYMQFLENFIKTHDIRRVVDIGCGDWSFSREISWGEVDYIGVDVVKHIVEKNQKLFSSPKVKFIHRNIFESDLPEGDLLLCKDMLQHLSDYDVHRFLEKTSQFKHCLITNDVDPHTLTSANVNIESGDWRTLDLTQPPFHLNGTKVLTYRSDRVVKQVLHLERGLEGKTVLLSILARNKEHTLPEFLQCIERLDYNKKKIGIYINTNDNCDKTLEILLDWIKKHQKNYRFITLETGDALTSLPTAPHEWTPNRFSLLGGIRNKSLKKTQEYELDYYFVVDCDNFITPCTLKELIKKDKPIIAPMLTAYPEKNDTYSNFFSATDPRGYYLAHPNYTRILSKLDMGTFQVPVVHCTYLIKSEYIDKLSYLDGSNDYEFVIFSRCARKNGVDQYICNEKDFGYLFHFYTSLTLEEEQKRVADFFSRLCSNREGV